jgi:hypothetical protein
LSARILEAQSVDTYYGWAREFIRAARIAGLGKDYRFTLDFGPDGQPLDDDELDRQTLRGLTFPLCATPQDILILEVDPEKQPSRHNLVLMAKAMAGNIADRRPAILDPRDVAVVGNRLFAKRKGRDQEIHKVISRLVDIDLMGFIRDRHDDGHLDVVERLRQIYNLPHLWGDLNKHLMGFYLVDKTLLPELARLHGLSLIPKTERITPDHLVSFRRDPALLDQLVIKPFHGMSGKSVITRPTIHDVELAVAREPMLAQELIWASPVQPDINPEVDDEDVRAGVCSEARLVMHGGCDVVTHNPWRARTVCVMTRSHFQSADPGRRIKSDPLGRGWYSNIGTILAVKADFGLGAKNHAGVGLAPVYWHEESTISTRGQTRSVKVARG